MPSKPSRPAGFTLIELLVVLAILALLASLVGPRVMNVLGGSRVKAARIQIQKLESALDLHRLDTGRYPETLEGLVRGDAPGWNGPYLKKGRLPQDPWGRPFIYRRTGTGAGYELLSLGADGRPGGEGEAADIRGEG